MSPSGGPADFPAERVTVRTTEAGRASGASVEAAGEDGTSDGGESASFSVVRRDEIMWESLPWCNAIPRRAASASPCCEGASGACVVANEVTRERKASKQSDG